MRRESMQGRYSSVKFANGEGDDGASDACLPKVKPKPKCYKEMNKSATEEILSSGAGLSMWRKGRDTRRR